MLVLADRVYNKEIDKQNRKGDGRSPVRNRKEKGLCGYGNWDQISASKVLSEWGLNFVNGKEWWGDV